LESGGLAIGEWEKWADGAIVCVDYNAHALGEDADRQCHSNGWT